MPQTIRGRVLAERHLERGHYVRLLALKWIRERGDGDAEGSRGDKGKTSPR